MDRHLDDRVVTFPQPLIPGTIVRRPNRFIIEVDLGGQAIAQGVEIWQVNLLIDPSGVRVGSTSNITTRFA